MDSQLGLTSRAFLHLKTQRLSIKVIVAHVSVPTHCHTQALFIILSIRKETENANSHSDLLDPDFDGDIPTRARF